MRSLCDQRAFAAVGQDLRSAAVPVHWFGLTDSTLAEFHSKMLEPFGSAAVFRRTWPPIHGLFTDLFIGGRAPPLFAKKALPFPIGLMVVVSHWPR